MKPLAGLEERQEARSRLVDGLELRVLDGTGRLLQETPGMPRIPPGQGGPRVIELANSGRFLVLESTWAFGRIQLARDLAPETRRLNRFRRALWATLGLTTLAAAFVGLWIARAGLRPLRHLADQARAIQPDALATRLHLAQPVELEGRQ